MIEIKNLCFTYSGGDRKRGLVDISLSIKKGEVLLLCGESGCGKTTLSRLINGLIPDFYEGELSGSVKLEGVEIHKQSLYETGKLVGSVFQNPKSQFYNVDTTGELVFGCENQGLSRSEILQRLENTVEDFKIHPLLNRSIFQLSGGEKQKIACASVSALNPSVLVLDEPSSSLDVEGVDDLRRMIELWKSEGKTVIVAEHRLYYLRNLIDRVIFMKAGRIEAEFGKDEFKGLGRRDLARLGLRPLRLEEIAEEKVNSPIDVSNENETIRRISLSGFQFSYKRGEKVLNLEDLYLPGGCATAIIGSNGSGKTTLARCLCGLNRKFKGAVEIEGARCKGKGLLENCYMVLQDVNHQLFTESVLDEVLLSMKEKNTDRAEEILKELDLLHLKEAHPLSLSGGQKQRVAIAGAVASHKEIIILDEPTSGLDLKHMKEVVSLINDLVRAGKNLIVISHDLEFILESCSYVIHIQKGMLEDCYFLDGNCEDKLKKVFMRHIGKQTKPLCSIGEGLVG